MEQVKHAKQAMGDLTKFLPAGAKRSQLATHPGL
jgi:hypothetical protein